MSIAIYPGTFDPITDGHTDLAARASALFDEVWLAIADNPGKTPLFNQAERIELAERALEHLENVRVTGFNSLLVDAARDLNAEVIIRGLRAVSDFEFEFQMATMNRRLAPDIETVYLTPEENYVFLSSSLVRNVASYQGDVSGLVCPAVEQALIKKFAS